MGITDQLKDLLEKALSMHSDFAVLNSSFERLERDVARLLDQNERRYEELQKQNYELRDRISSLEATFDGAVKGSLREALVQVAREHLAEKGELPTDIQLDDGKPRIQSE